MGRGDLAMCDVTNVLDGGGFGSASGPCLVLILGSLLASARTAIEGRRASLAGADEVFDSVFTVRYFFCLLTSFPRD
jgi:hypothetical protein